MTLKNVLTVIKSLFLGLFIIVSSCADDGMDGANGLDGENGQDGQDGENGQGVSLFTTQASVEFVEGTPEISTYDATTQTLYATNAGAKQVEVIRIAEVNAPQLQNPIDITAFGGNINSVASKNGFLALAVEAETSTDNGKIIVFKTDNLTIPYLEANAGALPDMITFTPDAKYIIAANEGEPNDAYSIDPEGSITLIEVATKAVSQISFNAFNSQEAVLEAQGFRVFGPGANLSADVEPEYIAVASDSKTAFIALQENNGIAKLDIASKTITAIYPLGTKDFSETFFDVSNRDDRVGNLNTWPVLSYYQPDAIAYFEVAGTGYIISANEGDARDYEGYSEEARGDDLNLDPEAFPNAAELQQEENLGRLKVTTANGDTDGDGDFDEIYGYGGRSFSIWSTTGDLVFDSGNEFTLKTLFDFGSYPEGRSDDKGTEPEAVTTYEEGGNTFAVIGLERSGDVLVYNITDVHNPIFVQRLRNTSPEGLLIIPAVDSPNGKTLLVVSNEFPEDGKLNIYSK